MRTWPYIFTCPNCAQQRLRLSWPKLLLAYQCLMTGVDGIWWIQCCIAQPIKLCMMSQGKPIPSKFKKNWVVVFGDEIWWSNESECNSGVVNKYSFYNLFLYSCIFPPFFLLVFFQDVVRKIEKTDVTNTRPVKEVIIVDSGVIAVDKPFAVVKDGVA